ncbi:hypothetical protein ACJX0J_015679, partial [Zea mays]
FMWIKIYTRMLIILMLAGRTREGMVRWARSQARLHFASKAAGTELLNSSSKKPHYNIGFFDDLIIHIEYERFNTQLNLRIKTPSNNMHKQRTDLFVKHFIWLGYARFWLYRKGGCLPFLEMQKLERGGVYLFLEINIKKIIVPRNAEAI